LEIRLRFRCEAYKSLVRIVLPAREDSTSATTEFRPLEVKRPAIWRRPTPASTSGLLRLVEAQEAARRREAASASSEAALRLVRKPVQVRVLDSASDFARVNCHGGADETAEGKIGGLAKSDQACADEGPGSAGQDSEAEEEDHDEAESGGRDQDSPVPKAAGEGYSIGTQARGAGTTRR